MNPANVAHPERIFILCPLSLHPPSGRAVRGAVAVREVRRAGTSPAARRRVCARYRQVGTGGVMLVPTGRCERILPLEAQAEWDTVTVEPRQPGRRGATARSGR